MSDDVTGTVQELFGVNTVFVPTDLGIHILGVEDKPHEKAYALQLNGSSVDEEVKRLVLGFSHPTGIMEFALTILKLCFQLEDSIDEPRKPSESTSIN